MISRAARYCSPNAVEILRSDSLRELSLFEFIASEARRRFCSPIAAALIRNDAETRSCSEPHLHRRRVTVPWNFEFAECGGELRLPDAGAHLQRLDQELRFHDPTETGFVIEYL